MSDEVWVVYYKGIPLWNWKWEALHKESIGYCGNMRRAYRKEAHAKNAISNTLYNKDQAEKDRLRANFSVVKYTPGSEGRL